MYTPLGHRYPLKLTPTVGKTLAYTNIKFLNSQGEVFARGSHTKYAPVPNNPNTILIYSTGLLPSRGKILRTSPKNSAHASRE
jgi:hypothetical protein